MEFDTEFPKEMKKLCNYICCDVWELKEAQGYWTSRSALK
jgi:hypothetical protein